MRLGKLLLCKWLDLVVEPHVAYTWGMLTGFPRNRRMDSAKWSMACRLWIRLGCSLLWVYRISMLAGKLMYLSLCLEISLSCKCDFRCLAFVWGMQLAHATENSCAGSTCVSKVYYAMPCHARLACMHHCEWNTPASQFDSACSDDFHSCVCAFLVSCSVVDCS